MAPCLHFRPTLRRAVPSALGTLFALSLGLASVAMAAPVARLKAAPVSLAEPFVIGSSNTATADPTIPRPGTQPCVVTLFDHVTFADFSAKHFPYVPPAGCTGPWARVVLEADYRVTAGRQFDRTARIAIGKTNVYFGTTAEPSATVRRSWHIERDLTDYGALLRGSQEVEASLGNVVDQTYTGILAGRARLFIYPAGPGFPAPRVPDAVVSLTPGDGGSSDLGSSDARIAPELHLPRNIEAAYLDVVAQSQADDEFWYTCVPDDLSDDLQSCPGTAFRETEVTIDGVPAGVAPIYPWLYTGAIDPLLWRPIVSVQTLSFEPYRVDLTPFAGLLSDGNPHKVGLQVFNARNHFAVAATLLLLRDPGRAQVTGAVTRNTLSAAPAPTIDNQLETAAGGAISGTLGIASTRRFAIEGYAETSRGKVVTAIDGSVAFSNIQDFRIDDSRYRQLIQQRTRIRTDVKTTTGRRGKSIQRIQAFPLDLGIDFVVAADGTAAQTTTVDQGFEDRSVRYDRDRISVDVESNRVSSADTLLLDGDFNITGFRDRKSAQTFIAGNDERGCYNRSIRSEGGLLTEVKDSGCR